MTEKENNIWVWESLTVKLTNPEGETITLNSLYFNDNTLTYLGKDLEEFVKNELVNYIQLILLNGKKNKYLSKNNLNFFSRINNFQ